MSLFICKACRTAYAATSQSEPSAHEPRCEQCNEPLPDRDGEDWMHYRRSPVVVSYTHA